MQNSEEVIHQKSINSYVLKVGKQASERLNLLDKVYGRYSRNILSQLIKNGMQVITFGCGTGNLEIWMSQHVGQEGRILAIDISMEQIKIAQSKTETLGIKNINFIQADVSEAVFKNKFDLVHCRYLLMHLRYPQQAVRKMTQLLKKNGAIVLEEIANKSGFSDPYNAHVKRAFNLMSKISQIHKLDYEIGHKLFNLLQRNNITSIEIQANQPLFSSGEKKTYLVQSIKEAGPIFINNNIISKKGLSLLIYKLEDFTNQSDTLIGLPTSYQILGIKR